MIEHVLMQEMCLIEQKTGWRCAMALDCWSARGVRARQGLAYFPTPDSPTEGNDEGREQHSKPRAWATLARRDHAAARV